MDIKHNVGHKKTVSRRYFMRVTGLSILGTSLLVACGDEGNTAVPATTTASVTGNSVSTTTGAVSGNAATTAATSAALTTAALPLNKPDEVATAFLNNWGASRYEAMYGLLSASAQNFIDQEKFVTRYKNIAEEATLISVSAKLGALPNIPGNVDVYEIPFTAAFKTARAGDFSQENTLQLVQEKGSWKIDWRPTNIFAGLVSPYLVRMFPTNSPRGSISDRTGQPMAKQGILFAVFVVPGKIENEEQLLTTLSQALAMDKTKIKDLYKNGKPDWRMDIKQLPGTTPQTTLDSLLAIKGVGVDETESRLYPNGVSGGQIVGYLSIPTQDELTKLAAKGYREEDKIGRTGVEAWGEDMLAGTKGGKLSIINPDGTVVTKLAERATAPGSNLVLTIDVKIQKAAEKALGTKVGSVVVMDPNDGAILAMATYPTYDPNAFIVGITQSQFDVLNNDPRRPFQNRPVNGVIPVGSTFKVITMAAALERLGMRPDTRFTCTGRWTGLGEAYAKDCYVKSGHGNITLYEALVQSCDVVFYELGKKLDETDANLLPAVAKGFGLGASTGIIGLSDLPGVIPDAQWKKEKIGEGWVRGDAVNLGIGQGYMLGTPLQMATAYAGIANGGQLPLPRLVARSEGGVTPTTYAPKIKQPLPISAANLAQVRNALRDVTIRGTARDMFSGYRVPVSGKTGTAESGKETPHAWFCSYAPSEKPKYVVVVALEEAGFGSDVAVPIARQVYDQLTF